MTLFPVFLDLQGKRVLVVGAGQVGLRRARALLEAGAHVTVVAPHVNADVRSLNVTVHERNFEPADLWDVRLVFACTNDARVNEAVAREAEARGVWCSSASRPELGSMRLGASLRNGDVLLAIQTGADLPYLSQALRDRISSVLPSHLPVREWSDRRQEALSLPDTERRDALSALKAEIEQAVRS